jgi:hypothetical protein
MIYCMSIWKSSLYKYARDLALLSGLTGATSLVIYSLRPKEGAEVLHTLSISEQVYRICGTSKPQQSNTAQVAGPYVDAFISVPHGWRLTKTMEGRTRPSKSHGGTAPALSYVVRRARIRVG